MLEGRQMRRAAKVDTVQQEIVDGLRAAGYRVEVIGRPVDLLIGSRLWELEDCLRGAPIRMIWTPMEIKTPTKTGARRVRRDQKAQDDFIRETGIPVVMSLTQALEALRGL